MQRSPSKEGIGSEWSAYSCNSANPPKKATLKRKGSTLLKGQPSQKPKPIIQRLSQSLKRIDRFAESFTFKYPQNTSRQFTFKGALLTILSYACLIYFGYSFYRKYTDSKNVETSISQEVSQNTPRMDILESGFYPIFSFARDPLINIPVALVPRYYSMTGRLMELKLEGQLQPGGKLNNLPPPNNFITEFEFKPCFQIQSKFKEKIIAGNEVARSHIDKYGMCPDLKESDEFYIEGNFYSPPRVQVVIQVSPCKLLDSTQCMTKRDIAATSFAITLPKISLNPEDEKNPTKIVPDIGGFEFIDPDSNSKLDIMVQKNEIWDDKSTLGNAEMVAEFFSVESRAFSTKKHPRTKYHCLPTDPDHRCTHYFLVNLKGSDTVNKIKRTYVGILSTLGELGGIFDLTLVVLSLLYAVSVLISCSERDLEANFLDRGRLESTVKSVTRTLGGGPEVRKRQNLNEGVIVDSVFADLMDGVDLVKTKMQANLFIQTFLGEEEKCLLPLILALRELKSRTKLKQGAHGGQRPEDQKKASQMTYQEAFSRVLDKQPKNDIEKAIKEFFINEIPGGLFSGSGNQNHSNMLSPWVIKKQDNSSTRFDLERPFPHKIKKMNRVAPKIAFHSSVPSQDSLGFEGPPENSPRLERDVSIVQNDLRPKNTENEGKKNKKVTVSYSKLDRD